MRSIRLFLYTVLVCMTSVETGARAAVEQLPNGMVVQGEGLRTRVLICNETTLRVTVTLSGEFPTREGLVVLKQWSPVRWSLRQEGGDVVIRTGALEARVNGASGSVTMCAMDGTVLLREDPHTPHQIVPAVVAGESTYSVLQRFVLTADEGIYGLGQFEDGVMNYRDHDITLIQNNRHVCVPFLVSSRGYGIYWDNYSHTRVHDGPDGMTFWSEVADAIDYYFFGGGSIDASIAAFREATGRAPLFPRWALGYWQSKERYETQDELLSIGTEYRRRHIPIDNIVQDWQYWGKMGWNAMAFDSSAYPAPRVMIDSLHRMNLHVVLSIWPQVDSATAVYRELKERGHLYPTEIWNGGKTYDAYSPEAREIYWKHLNRGLYSLGVDAWWVDATEPDWKWCDSLLEEKEGIVRNGMTALGSSARYLNAYALMTTKGIYENQRKTNPHRRVVMLTRSAFAGQQRNATAIWSGDIASTWDVFRNQIAAGVNISMAGIPYWNSDIGGFLPKEYGGDYPLGTRDPAYNELYVRWFQFGAFCPIFRSHGTDFPKEVWRFGEPGSWAYDALVRFIDLRYRLLPYTYSVAWDVTSAHSTMMRGLVMDFPRDPLVRNNGTEYMFGKALLAAPVTQPMYHPRRPGVLVPPSNLRAPDGMPGLRGAYFAGMKFDTLTYTRRDSVIHFTWTSTGAPGVGKNRFSVRWEGRILSNEAGLYQFEILSDDGVNFFLDGKQLMDEMYPAGLQKNIGETVLAANTWYDIRIEYYQETQGATIALTWRTPSMLGPSATEGTVQSTDVYLPASTAWYDFWTGERMTGGQTVGVPAPIDRMPLFVRSGAMLPLGPRVEYAVEKPADPLELRIYRGADGHFEFYEDGNDGYGYEQGAYAVIPLAWKDTSSALILGERIGSFPGMKRERTFHIVLVGKNHGVGVDEVPAPDRVVRYSGSKQTVRF